MCMMCVCVHLSMCWVTGDCYGCVRMCQVSFHGCVMFGTL